MQTSDDEDCICDVVVLEQPHCIVVRSKGLDSIDTLGERTSFGDDVFMTRKPRSRLCWMPAANVASVKDGRSTQVAPFLGHPTNWMDIMLVRQLLADKPFDVTHASEGPFY
jgi:hypothetical protein